MRNKKTFIHWYYSDGVNAFIGAVKRVIAFIPYFFSLSLLVRTIFAPWHRDVSLKDWRGFNPLKTSQRFLWNTFSRIIGAIVRLSVICVALVAFVLVAIFSISFLLVYFAFPGIAIAIVVFFFAGYYTLSAVSAVLMGLVVYWSRRTYREDFHLSYRKMSVMMLAQQPWFIRVWRRMGVTPDEVTKDVLENFDAFKELLRKHDITVDESEDIMAWEMERQIEREERKKLFSEKQLKAIRPIGLHWHFGYTVHLDEFVKDLTAYDMSKYADIPFFAHEEELEMLELIMSRPSQNNALILGKPGVGRKLLAHELARRIRKGNYDGTPMQYMRVLKADFSAALSQAQEQGFDPEYVTRNLFHEAAYAENVILVLENFEKYMTLNRGFAFPAIIDDYAGLPTFRIIGITSENQYHAVVADKEAMMQSFDMLHVGEMDEVAAMKTLFMRFYHTDRTVFTYQSFREIITTSTRYVNTGPLPERAVDLATEVLLEWQKKSKEQYITKEFVDDFVRHKTGIPVGTITTQEQGQLLSLEENFHKRIVGQNDAVNAIAEAVRRMRSGMARPNRPAGSFLFLGPTGVGKTEMAKTLAEQYFGSQEKVIRLDMSEFQGPAALEKFIGSRALGQKGRLAKMVKDHPYALLLLDEIEKANPRVLDLFLQILDEGFAHDAFGKKMNFTTMIIIATSNAGSLTIKKMMEENIPSEQMHKKLINTIVENGTFRQEFLNRFDDLIIFHPINDVQVLAVTHLLLKKFAQRVERDQNIKMTFNEGVAEKVVEKGFDQMFGARSILRFIDDSVANALAKKLIAGNVNRGDDIEFTIDDLDR